MYNVVAKKVHVRYLISWWVSCQYQLARKNAQKERCTNRRKTILTNLTMCTSLDHHKVVASKAASFAESCCWTFWSAPWFTRPCPWRPPHPAESWKIRKSARAMSQNVASSAWVLGQCVWSLHSRAIECATAAQLNLPQTQTYMQTRANINHPAWLTAWTWGMLLIKCAHSYLQRWVYRPESRV